ncbi:hypothetical protein BDV96DRAFT_654432 [Lophiotrema nucula]|uniref:Uncharacterized protein n=1 Tax=Lophiotrema nucula TaxID=690887 RepID=A0A6A5YI46_9PLEO|nr:hypothetical protein BDV96DRAFT_654432 [Lophiotrema nucula]
MSAQNAKPAESSAGEEQSSYHENLCNWNEYLKILDVNNFCSYGHDFNQEQQDARRIAIYLTHKDSRFQEWIQEDKDGILHLTFSGMETGYRKFRTGLCFGSDFKSALYRERRILALQACYDPTMETTYQPGNSYLIRQLLHQLINLMKNEKYAGDIRKDFLSGEVPAGGAEFQTVLDRMSKLDIGTIYIFIHG